MKTSDPHGNPAADAFDAGGREPALQPTSTICVAGLGYIGLPTSAVLASRGYQVCGVDVRPDVVDTINRGEIHLQEPHLDCLVRDTVASGKLRASLQPQEADVFFLCVPTPVNRDKSPDLSYVEQAARAIRPYIRPGNLVILESTSPPGTTRKTVVPHAVPEGMTVGRDVFVAHCPERVLPGRILIEVVENDRIIGGVTEQCTARATSFYRTFVTGQLLGTSDITAELAKLVENSFRDVNIAFANELSMLSQHFDADPLEVIELANRHPRVNILNPGPGVGGHCISVDPWFLAHAAPQLTELIRTAREVNDRKPQFVVQQIEQLVERHGIKKIGCLGLTYKADTDDLRQSPSLQIVHELHRRRLAELFVCDPLVNAEQFQEFSLCSLQETLQQSELVVLLTDHTPFKTVTANQLAGKLVLDTRGSWRLLTPNGGRAASLRIRPAA